MHSKRLLRFGLLLTGIFLAAWGLVDHRFRDAEGVLSGSFALPISSAVAFFVLAFGIGRAIAAFTFWSAVGLIGQAAALQMINAGKAIHYQHYKSAGHLLTHEPHLLLLLLLQLILVSVALKSQGKSILKWFREQLTTSQKVFLIFAFVLSSTVVSRPPSYFLELLFATLIQFVNLFTVVLAVRTLPQETTSDLHQKIEKMLNGSGSLVWICAVWVAAIALFLNLVSYQRHPHLLDEVIYLIHARFLAHGNITLPAPPVPEAFTSYLTDVQGNRWFPVTLPGWPAILALGTLIDMPWLVNPVLGGLNLFLIFRLLSQLYDARLARFAVLLFAASPWYIFLSMSFMTHIALFTCALIAAVSIESSRRNGKIVWGILAGIAVGIGVLIRPLDGIFLGALLGLWILGLGGKRLRASAIAAFAVVTIAISAIHLPLNRYLTGNATRFAINVYNDRVYGTNANLYGFGPDRGMGWPLDPFPGHGPLDALVNASLNVFSLNTELFGWSIGSILPAALLLAALKFSRADYLMIVVIATVFIEYFFYYYSGGPDFGARYWFLMILPLIALSIRGIDLFASKLQEANRGRVLVGVFILTAFSIVNFIPWRAADKYYRYLLMRPDVRLLSRHYDFRNGLILIQGPNFPDYASANVYNPLDFRGEDPLYAWYRDKELCARIVEAFPDRQVWIVKGPTRTGKGYQIIAGPVTSSKTACTY